MEDLTRQQIILLTLFTTFVTSIATGIVTVSLVDQAPTGVTSVIEHVINHTVADAVDAGSTVSAGQNSASVSQAVDALDPTENATSIAQKSLVKIVLVSSSSGSSSADSALGIILSKTGLIATDKSNVAMFGDYVAVLPNGQRVPVDILQSQNDGDIVFLLMQNAANLKLTPAILVDDTGSDAPKLGQSVLALSGTDSVSVNPGIIKKIKSDASSTVLAYVTSIDPSETLVGSPLFDLSGKFIGIKTFSFEGNGSDAYYPLSLLKSAIPVFGQVPVSAK